MPAQTPNSPPILTDHTLRAPEKPEAVFPADHVSQPRVPFSGEQLWLTTPEKPMSLIKGLGSNTLKDTVTKPLPSESKPVSIESQAEKGSMSQERIREIASNSFYSTHFRVDGVAGQRTAFHAPNGLHRSNYAARTQVEDRFARSDMEKWSKMFSDSGVAEVVTVAKVGDMSDPSLDLRPFKDEMLNGEPVYAVQYATQTQDNSRYAFKDGLGRTGSWNGFVALMPESMAKELEVSLKSNPAQVREVFNLLSEYPDADYNNDQTRGRIAENGILQPPFEQWRQQDGGVSRIAFRTASNQGPEQSEVLEF